MVLLVLAPVVRLGHLQFVGAEHLVNAGKDQRTKKVVLPGYRGAIVDRNGADLAVSLPRRTVAANMKVLRLQRGRDRDQFAARLAPTLGLDVDEVTGRLADAENDDQWVLLGNNVEPDAVDAAKEMLDDDATRAWLRAVPASERVQVAARRGQAVQPMDDLTNLLDVQETTVRSHPAGESALRVVGKLSADGTAGPRAGIERLYDRQLSGTDGLRTYERGTRGQTIAGSERLVSPARSGADVQLTLDRTLQFQVERILARGAQNGMARRGVAVVGRPSTGELLAVASVQRDQETKEMRLSDSPVAFDSSYQAGSVFKLMTIAAATEAGLVHTDTAFSVPWRIQVADRVFQDHDQHPTERMTTKDILAKSSNVGTIKIAQLLGKDRLHQALADFGFGRRTEVGSPAESSGLLPPVAEWYPSDLAASAIGTHVSGTPIQIWSAYNVIANEGRYVAPRLVDATIGADGRRTPLPARPTRQVISPAAAAEVATALAAVVEEGTGKQWSMPGYPVAAKTGTSRMPSPKRVDTKDGYRWADGVYHYVTTFTGFFPVDNPQVSITVMLEDVPPGSSGATTAGPVFSDLAHLAIRELAIAPTEALDGPAGPASPTAKGAPAVAGAGPVRAAPAVAGAVSATERQAAARRPKG
ncbi:MAG: penicillin-binding transpeptidase domain-containing protein, partial [Actinomycetes bacterium]